MVANHDVVITGLGVVSPIGIGRGEFVRALRDRRSGVAHIQQYDASEFSVRFGAELKDFQPKLYVQPRKSLKVMCREIQAGVSSAAMAVEDARLDTERIDSERFGVVFGCPMLYADMHELADLFRQCSKNGDFDFSEFGQHFPKQMQPLWMLKYLPNMTVSHIGIAHNARAANNSIVMGDVSSLLAIIEAATVIQRGLCDVMLAGGTGNRLSLTGVVYRGDSNLSHNQNPEQASRPFDAHRDGMVLGEGAGTLVLEDRAHAERRGATILGRILGFSTTHVGRASGCGMSNAIARSILCCLEQARSTNVGQINAHGLSDKQHDAVEARAINAAIGSEVPTTAPKSYFGNVGAASGVLELSASLCMINQVPPTLNFQHPDPACAVRVSNDLQEPLSTSILKLNQTGTGQAVSLLVDTQ